MGGSDYIIGSTQKPLEKEEDLYFFIRANKHKALELVVYSTQHETSRLVHLTPDPDWGGDGRLVTQAMKRYN